MNGVTAEFRKMRIIHVAFITAAFLYAYMLTQMRLADRGVKPEVVIALGFLAIADLGIALSFRARWVRTSEERLRSNPDDAAALKQWRTGTLITFSFAESIVLFGVLLKFLGADWKVAGAFFALGTLLMLLWTPRLDVPAVNQ